MSGGITEAQRRALLVLAPALEPGTYLAGGVAVAATLQHRFSLDLDFFVPHEFDEARLEEVLTAHASVSDRAVRVRVVGRARGTMHLEVGDTPVSVLSYRYPLLAPPAPHASVPFPLASLEDLACMKISAIAGRGAAKDFWDLDGLLEHGVANSSLARALELYARKFPIEDIGHAVRSLAYFADGDAAPLPLGLSRERWIMLKSAFADRVKALR